MVPIEFDIIVFKENKIYASYCPELDISSCISEEAEKMGTLEDILDEANYVKNSNGKWMPLKLIAAELASI